MKDSYELTFFSELSNVKSAIMDILKFINESAPSIASEDLSDLRLVFNELLCNAVIHGNKNDFSKKVNVLIEFEKNTLNAVITDEGTGFDYKSLLKAASCPADTNDEGGRGIFLVYSLTDLLCFNNKGNQIKFYKKVSFDG